MQVINIGHQKTIVKNDAGVIGISYSTPVLFKPTGLNVLFENENYYSVTTAKHKSILKREIYYTEIIEVNAGTLFDLINGDINPEEVIKEYTLKRYLIKTLNNEDAIPNNYKLKEFIKNTDSKRQEYKNGNIKRVNKYITKFNYCSNIYFKITNRIFYKKVKYYANSSTGWNVRKETEKATFKAVIYS